MDKEQLILLLTELNNNCFLRDKIVIVTYVSVYIAFFKLYIKLLQLNLFN